MPQEDRASAEFDAHTAMALFFVENTGEIPQIFKVERGKINRPDSTRPADPYTYLLVTFSLGCLTTGEEWKIEVQLRALVLGMRWEPDWVRITVGKKQSVYHARKNTDSSQPYFFDWGYGQRITRETLHPHSISR